VFSARGATPLPRESPDLSSPRPSARAPILGARKRRRADRMEKGAGRQVWSEYPPRQAAVHPYCVSLWPPGPDKSISLSMQRLLRSAGTIQASLFPLHPARPRETPAHPKWVQVCSHRPRQINITFNATPRFGAPQQYKRPLPIPLPRTTSAHPFWVQTWTKGTRGQLRVQCSLSDVLLPCLAKAQDFRTSCPNPAHPFWVRKRGLLEPDKSISLSMRRHLRSAGTIQA
jgi:hypothetical protein